MFQKVIILLMLKLQKYVLENVKLQLIDTETRIFLYNYPGLV